MKTLLFILSLLPVVASAIAPKETFEKLNSANPDSALSDIQTLTKKDNEFQWGLQEMARVYYKENRWSEFFGIAYYSRKALPVSMESERIRLMEVLALVRHCQNEQAREVMKARPFPQDKDLSKHFAVLAELLQIPTMAKSPTKKIEKGKGAFPNANLWPVADLSLESLGPYRLRRNVEAKCEKGAQ